MLSNQRSTNILLFQVADMRGAFLVEDVVEVLRAIAITSLQRAPYLIEGIIDLRGQVVPVIDLRVRFGLPKRDVALSDRLIVLRAGQRTVAMRVDAAGTIATIDSADLEDAARTGPNHAQLRGVAKLEDGLALIHDAGSFLTATEEEELERALAKNVPT